MPKTAKRFLLGRGKGYLSAAGPQYRFIFFILLILGVYTFLLKIFQKLAEIVALPVFFPIAAIILLFFVGVVGTVYSHGLIGPMVRIRSALEQMAKGDLHVNLRLRDTDDPLLKDLGKVISELCEHGRNSQVLIQETAKDLSRDIHALQDKVHQGADAAEVQKRVEGVIRKMDLLDKAIKAHGKV